MVQLFTQANHPPTCYIPLCVTINIHQWHMHSSGAERHNSLNPSVQSGPLSCTQALYRHNTNRWCVMEQVGPCRKYGSNADTADVDPTNPTAEAKNRRIMAHNFFCSLIEMRENINCIDHCFRRSFQLQLVWYQTRSCFHCNTQAWSMLNIPEAQFR